MSSTAPGLPLFMQLSWLERDIELVRRDDGSMILRSRVPLGPARHTSRACCASGPPSGPGRPGWHSAAAPTAPG